MHPELIKAHLRIGGTTPTAIAEELGVNPQTVSQVIHGTGSSRRVAQRISDLLGKPLEELWPAVYGPNRPRSLTRRRDAIRKAA